MSGWATTPALSYGLIDEIIEGHGRLTATNGAGAAAEPRSVDGSCSGGPGGSAATRGEEEERR